MPEDFKDRRQFVRIYRNFILTYWLKDKAEVKFDVSQVNNISRGGVSFIATTSLPVGREVTIELRTPFLADTLTLEGNILDCREKIEGLIFEIRVKFGAVSPLAVETLQKIERYSSEEI